MRCALLGRTLGHSHSPAIHAQFGRYDYELLAVEEDALEKTLRDETFAGFNVTIPYKQTVMSLLDEISPEARRIGAVNTVVRKDGRLFGYNTDYFGFLSLAKHAGVDFKNKVVCVLGSGGTAHTVCAAVTDAGAKEVFVVSRTGRWNYENIAEVPAEVLVNTTPVGMYPSNDGMPVDPARIPTLEAVLDVVYNPLRTQLILRAKELGLTAEGGLYMLVMQAVAAGERFLSEALPEGMGDRVYRSLLKQLENIAFVGMPGSGKTTAARMLAEKTGRTFVDLDAEIEKTAGVTIPEIFEKEGEQGFRDRESAEVSRFSKQSGLVIACGGGAILREENRAALRRNARVYWIRRNRAHLAMDGRPLSKDADALKIMEETRTPLYRAAADAQVENDGTPEGCVAKIMEDIYAPDGTERPEP